MKNSVKSFTWALIAASPFLLSPGSFLSAQNTVLSLTEEVHDACSNPRNLIQGD